MFTVITHAVDGITTVEFSTKNRALAHMKEEVLWEGTLSVECPELGVKFDGSFLSIRRIYE